MDNGKSWDKINFVTSAYIGSIRITENDVIFLDGMMENIWGIFRSTNFGLEWTQVIINGKIARQISYGSPNIMIATTEKGIYKSEDNAINWSLVDTTIHYGLVQGMCVDGQGNIYVWPYSGVGMKKLAMNTSIWQELLLSNKNITIRGIVVKDGGFIIAITNENGFFISKDDGKTWVPSNTSSLTYTNTVALLPSGTLLLAAGNNLFRSTDNGNSWHVADTLFQNHLIWSIAAAPSGQIFTGSETYGLFYSSDDGRSWSQIKRSFTPTKCIVINYNNELFVSVSNIGNFFSHDNGDSWSKIWTETSARRLYVNSSGTLFSIDGVNLCRFEKETGLWETLTYNSYYSISPLTIAANGDFYLAFPGPPIHGTPSIGYARRSTDNGNTWLAVPINYNPNRFVADPSGPIYFYTAGGNFRTTDSGSHWENVTIPAFANILNTSNGLKVAATNTGIQASNDNGLTWTPLSLIGLDVRILLVNSKGHYFAATDSGIFRSLDNCSRWEAISYNLPTQNIVTADLGPDGSLYVGLQEGGIYRTVESTITFIPDADKPTKYNFALDQNFPNPFNPSTQIQYSVPSRQHIKITIYDVLGRTVETLADEIKEQGNYTITWNPTNLPSGVYLYRLESASYTETRKLILLR